ncbi:hypothetical protein C8J56DRAFT_1052506 [Mycena floridula]|nr:hypothetical protein C8J56DRAFT_1052506 [Mycena floridula]
MRDICSVLLLLKGQDDRGQGDQGETRKDGMESAIPQWRHPVRTDGNWDDVSTVFLFPLPKFCRFFSQSCSTSSSAKAGLEGIRADRWGPRPKKSERVEPTPGTFGYDHSKYRPPRAGDEFSPVPFDEFGRPTRVAEEDNEGQEISRIRSHMTKFTSEAMVGISNLLHLLFSFHITLLLRQQRPTYRESVPQKQEEEDGAGCCKCVVM